MQYKVLQIFQKNLLPSAYAVRQMIAHAVTVELFRQEEAAVERRIGRHLDLQAKPTSSAAITKETKPNIKVEEKVAKDFFGRVIEVNEEEVAEMDRKKEVALRQIRYVYNEGSSNAVRRPLPVKTLMSMIRQ